MDMVGDERIFQQLNVQAHLMKPARANLLKGAIIDVVRTARIHGSLPPASQAAMAVEQSPGGLEPQSAWPVPDALRKGPKVLIAEDNQVNQIVFRQILTSSDIDFRIVGNGEDVLKILRSETVDLVLMDVSMPLMNGYQAAVLIREDEKQRGKGEHVPIIGITAHALDSDRDACLEAGMDDYLSKPISPEILLRKIEQWNMRASSSALIR
jgi:CheY-like chemotaxis protein